MKVRVDADVCVGHGRCYVLAPEVYEADERLGQRVVAAVQLEPGAELDERALLERCGEQLARYKVPDRIVFLDALPRNAMSKVVKRDLEPLFRS